MRHHFASDNYAGMCPEAWAALAEANSAGHTVSYGDDSWTARAKAAIAQIFETACDVHFVFNGTAANALVLAHLCQPYHAVITSPLSHLETDECGAPEYFTGGTKLLTSSPAAPGARLAKLDPGDVDELATRRTDVHFSKPRMVSIAQTTELGAVYTPAEVRALADRARHHQLLVHMDGARFANAVAALGVAPADITWRAGVDVLCFGGTKNGLAIGEAVVFFRRDLATDFHYRIKQSAQLASKMRLITAPWVGVLESGAWLRHAQHANDMAALLESLIRDIPGVDLFSPRDANAVFARMPTAAMHALWADGWRFYDFAPPGGCRLMCAWDTDEASVRTFTTAVRTAVALAK